jgi:hypothetical protein
VPKIDRQAIYERDNGLCGFCLKPVRFAEFEADHYPPRALDTSSSTLRVSHRLCNRRGGWDVRHLLNPIVATAGYPLRIRRTLKAELERLAKLNRRSLNSEIVWRLEQSVVQEEKS